MTTEQQRRDIATDRSAGATVAELVEKYGVSPRVVYRSSEIFGFNLPDDRIRVRPGMREEIVRLYGLGRGAPEIARGLGVGTSTVRRELEAAGVKCRINGECNRTYTLTQSAFDAITEESCYWGGFLLTDGFVSRGSVGITLSVRDRSHVEKFGRFLGSNQPRESAAAEPGTAGGRRAGCR